MIKKNSDFSLYSIDNKKNNGLITIPPKNSGGMYFQTPLGGRDEKGKHTSSAGVYAPSGSLFHPCFIDKFGFD